MRTMILSAARAVLGSAMSVMVMCPAFAETTSTRPHAPVVALLTDFGTATEAVGLCHGAILSINSDLRIVDLCHDADAYDILLGALMLRGTTVFPRGSVFVGVIDPGVGTSRQPVALRTRKGFYYVAPNNGLLTYVIRDQGVEEVVILDERRINPDWEPGTFDGRDLFSPAGALLASTGGDLRRLGRPATLEDLQMLEVPQMEYDAATGALAGVYLRRDEPYGNVWTNITADDLTSAGIKFGDTVELSGRNLKVSVPLVVSFGHVPVGKPLAYIASNGGLAFAINQGSFSDAYALSPRMRLSVKKAAPSGPNRD